MDPEFEDEYADELEALQDLDDGIFCASLLNLKTDSITGYLHRLSIRSPTTAPKKGLFSFCWLVVIIFAMMCTLPVDSTQHNQLMSSELHHNQDFREEGAPTPKVGAPTYYLVKNFPKTA